MLAIWVGIVRAISLRVAAELEHAEVRIRIEYVFQLSGESCAELGAIVLGNLTQIEILGRLLVVSITASL